MLVEKAAGVGASGLPGPTRALPRAPPSQPSPASGGRSGASRQSRYPLAAKRQGSRPISLPRLRGRAGGGGVRSPWPGRALPRAPHPNLPPRAGDGAEHRGSPVPRLGRRGRDRARSPSPACGGGRGWGPPAAMARTRAAARPHPNLPPRAGESGRASPLPLPLRLSLSLPRLRGGAVPPIRRSLRRRGRRRLRPLEPFRRTRSPGNNPQEPPAGRGGPRP